MIHIISNLVQIRKLKQLSQSEVARKLELAQSYLARLETHRLDPGLSRVEEIAGCYGYTLMLVPNEKVAAVSLEISDREHPQRLEDTPLYAHLRDSEVDAIDTVLQELRKGHAKP